MFALTVCPTEISKDEYIDNRVVLFHSIKKTTNFVLDHLGIKKEFKSYINTQENKSEYDEFLDNFRFDIKEFEFCAKEYGRAACKYGHRIGIRVIKKMN